MTSGARVSRAAALAGAGGALLVITVGAYQRLKRQRANAELAAVGTAEVARCLAALSFLDEDDSNGEQRLQMEADELLTEQLSRNIAYLGELGQSRFANSYVVVVGVGAVGSHAAHLLGRDFTAHRPQDSWVASSAH